jgi:hypothetical protein
MSIEWDEDGLKKLTDEIVQEQADELQGIFDRVLGLAPGRTVDEIKTLLAQELNVGGDAEIDDEELTEYAQTLAEGTRIEVQSTSR